MYDSQTSAPETTPELAPGTEPVTAPAQEEQPLGPSLLSVIGEIAQTVVLALLLFFIIRNFIQNYRVENISMEPNFHEGQFLIINRFAYCPGLHLDIPPLGVRLEKSWCVWTPGRGDVIVFHYPPDPSKDYIKRVIGLPGETVEVRQGRVFINGKLMTEPFGPNPGSYTAPPVKLGPSQIYVMGDNRNSSSDSHVWGPVPMANVVGRAIVRYWPPSKWSVIPRWNFPELGGKS